MRKSNMKLVFPLLLSIAGYATADCECGYSSTIDNSAEPYVFTDLIESDFLHLPNITKDTDWRRQSFNKTPAEGRGPYGMDYSIAQVTSNPILDENTWTGEGENGGDPGLQLSVSGGIPANGYVKTAELDSMREDLLWGTYRTAMKLTLNPGTCSAFFWYFNDSQEIDMEFLSSQFNRENNTFPVNLVLQSVQSVHAGYNAANTGNYVVANLPFDPTTGYHEYRFDFIPNNVIFYADGQVLAKMNSSAVPTSPGHMILTQWSNGNPQWSSGPPTEDTSISVSYVKAYFNSSDPMRASAFNKRCKDPHAANAICAVPDQTAAPNPNDPTNGNASASTYFFSNQQNQTNNQTVYKKSGAPGSIAMGSFASVSFFVLLSSITMMVL
ncbi:glycoside hydrolase family 16 protein [Rutstroemia sp. NJR-2017a WRK4]|nr:glycoside hydrolase family 16 protein [Rutstroemia sp. NJR-2017a WRK4]